jgi:hypothetical protein
MPATARSLNTERRQAIARSRMTRRNDSRRMPAWALTILCLGGATYTVLFALAIADANSELLQALTLAPVLVASIVPIALHIARAERDATLVGIVMAAIVAKLLAGLLRFYVAFEVYSNSDALQYHLVGESLVDRFREGVFDPGIGKLVGTNFIKIFTGIVYAVFGVSRIGGFLVFSWMGFLGLILMARAFRVAVPQGDARRYLILVLFLPSLLYWPASLGKEAWMMLALGLCAYGVACILRGRGVGIVSLGLGLLAVSMVRPHMGLVVFVGLVFALLLLRVPARTYAAPLFRVLGLVALLVAGVVLASQTATFIGEPTLTADAVTSQLDNTEVQTADGGSEFSPVPVNTPVDMVPAFVTVFFRPFPFEASNAQALLVSAECLLILGLALASWKRIRAVPRLIRSTPYVAFCIGYVLVFVYAFSSFSNFGLLARQRVQALPFLLVLFALPEYQTLPRRSRRKERRAVPQSRAPTRPRRRALEQGTTAPA